MSFNQIMSQQSFSHPFREALWETHGKKCLYCEQGLLFRDLVIDHVIAESNLELDIEQLNELYQKYGLDSNFDIRGSENLAASCNDCNSKKIDNPFSIGYTNIILGKVKSKLPALEMALEKGKSIRDLDNIIRAVQRSIDKGQFTYEELYKNLELAKKFPNGISGASSRYVPSPEAKLLGDELYIAHSVEFSLDAKRYIQKNRIKLSSITRMIHTAAAQRSVDVRKLPGHSTYIIKSENFRLITEITDRHTKIIEICSKG